MAALKDLPMLRDTSAARREALFQQKLQLCAVVFNFDDPQVGREGGREGESDEIKNIGWPLSRTCPC